MSQLNTTVGKIIVIEICDVIIANKSYLSQLDGLIGDGDHGINMAKGFSICKTDLEEIEQVNLAQALQMLANVLIGTIGGSIGPLYGSFFLSMSLEIDGSQTLNKKDFNKMMTAGLLGLQEISSAKVGDKTMMDTLIPAVKAFQMAIDNDVSFSHCLGEMKTAAIDGADSTKDLIAKVGRSSRLGERSRGVLDAGAISLSLILTQLASSVDSKLIDE